MARDGRRDLSVLRRKRDANRYRTLVEIADRQPAVSQSEIADAIGVTTQAVSEYVGDLVGEGFVRKGGRGRYEVTKEGVDWLISRTDELREFAEYVSEEVVERVETEAAIAAGPIEAGETVSLSMRDGVIHAAPDGSGEVTAVAVTDARGGEPVGVTDFEGLFGYDTGSVTILTVPPIADGRARIDPDRTSDLAAGHDVLAVAGTEALAAARLAGHEPDMRFGTPSGIGEAAVRGLDVFLIAVETAVPAHLDRLREGQVRYEVVDAAADRRGT